MEASLLHKVQSVPGVIQLHECFLSGGNFYMIMELVPKAISLYDYMEKSGKLPLKDIKRLFVDIVKTVQRCLNAGVSHKDIKTENVLLYRDPISGEFNIKLIDFGCGETIKGYMGRHTGGTTIYWPPEYRRWRLPARPGDRMEPWDAIVLPGVPRRSVLRRR
ncbi:serine/threonine-protein kinase pim-3-like [Oratosquilla oratoria]|uniref:serine/threonine-protein kinase pim-3-like n=1 Tax=Oratosquilla oratoria TaxID=337810 RepID=UPI003F772018